MKLPLKDLIPALLALLVLGLVGTQTSQALRLSGSWHTRPGSTALAADPYARLDALIARSQGPPPPAGLRDPFSFGPPPGPGRVSRPIAVKPPPAPPPRPVVTAIVADNDPRALIRYENRNYSVKTGDQFAQFRVVSISAERVVLEAGTERLILKRPSKGE